MKSFTVGVLALAALALAKLAFAQSIDTKYLALMVWANQINKDSIQWDAQCDVDKPNPECEIVHKVMLEQMRFFIECANRYQTDGNSCGDKMRGRVITHDIKLFSWNIDCSGQDKSPTCDQRAAAVDAEQKQLEKDMDACDHEKKL
jgi:hypothetical protein